MRPDSEQRSQKLLWDVFGRAGQARSAWCQYGMDAQAKAAREATWKAKQQHWMEGQEGQADSMARLQETGDWAATWVCGAQAGGPQEAPFPSACANVW